MIYFKKFLSFISFLFLECHREIFQQLSAIFSFLSSLIYQIGLFFFFNKFSRNFKKFRLNENNFCIFVLENILIIDIISGEGVESGIGGEVSFFGTTTSTSSSLL